MLDTNIASCIIHRKPRSIVRRANSIPADNRCISAITMAELLYGTKHKTAPIAIPDRVKKFIMGVRVLPWDAQAAQQYGGFREETQNMGITLSAMDMLIAVHSVSVGATLVTQDKSFSHIKHMLSLEDWTEKNRNNTPNI